MIEVPERWSSAAVEIAYRDALARHYFDPEPANPMVPAIGGSQGNGVCPYPDTSVVDGDAVHVGQVEQ